MAGQTIKLYEIGCGGIPSINIGALRHSITIQAQAPKSPPEFGVAGEVTAWTDFATATAAIQAIRGLDAIRGGMAITQLYMTIALWWIPGVEPNMRVKFNDSMFVIQSVDNILMMDTVLVLNCVALGSASV